MRQETKKCLLRVLLSIYVVFSIFDASGFDLIVENDSKQFLKEFRNAISNVYDEEWYNLIHNENSIHKNKLRTYCKFKTSNNLEDYVITVTNPYLRKDLTKFRISAHSLKIEKGRRNETEVNKNNLRILWEWGN